MRYLSVTDLKEKLASRRVAIPQGACRAELIHMCRQHRVVRDSQVSSKATRREWIVSALRGVGCELREDSRLCEKYIEEGEGDLDIICKIMVEMKFYYAHTDYKAILDDINDVDVFPLKMLLYNDGYDASEHAKVQALDAWIGSLAAPMASLEHPELPESLRKTVTNRIKHLEFSKWSNRAFFKKRDRKYAHKVACSWLSRASFEECKETTFESMFGDRIRRRAK
jgi:hypothetical protein